MTEKSCETCYFYQSPDRSRGACFNLRTEWPIAAWNRRPDLACGPEGKL